MSTTLKVCTKLNSNPAPIDTSAIVERVILVAEYLAGKTYYPYQRECATAFITSVLEHDGEVFTALFARQSGKTEVISGCSAAMGLLLPVLANMELFKDDWRLNITDDQGNYRGFKNGIAIGIYAPRQDQCDNMFGRICRSLESPRGEELMKEVGVSFDTFRGEQVRLSNGTLIRSKSASEQSKIEGETYHVLVLEEAQDLGDMKVRKSLHPMVSSVRGTIMKIGTCSINKCDFYMAIKANERKEAATGKRLHFYYPHSVCEQYNSLYKEYINDERSRIGEDSDEFVMAYKCKWILERGMFISDEKLFADAVTHTVGPHAEFWTLRDSKTGFYRNSTQKFLSSHFTTQVAGIDFGKVHDPTVVCIIDVDWAHPVIDQYVETLAEPVHFLAFRKHIVDFYEIQGDNYEEQFEHITGFLNRFKGLRRITLDATGVGQWGHDKFVTYYNSFNAGLDMRTNLAVIHQIEIEPFTFAPSNQSEGFKLFQSDLLSGRLSIPCGDHTRKTREFKKFIAQMRDLRKDYVNGNMVCKAPDEPGAHDDYCDAAMLACWGANKPADSGLAEAVDNFFVGRNR